MSRSLWTLPDENPDDGWKPEQRGLLQHPGFSTLGGRFLLLVLMLLLLQLWAPCTIAVVDTMYRCCYARYLLLLLLALFTVVVVCAIYCCYRRYYCCCY